MRHGNVGASKSGLGAHDEGGGKGNERRDERGDEGEDERGDGCEVLGGAWPTPSCTAHAAAAAAAAAYHSMPLAAAIARVALGKPAAVVGQQYAAAGYDGLQLGKVTHGREG